MEQMQAFLPSFACLFARTSQLDCIPRRGPVRPRPRFCDPWTIKAMPVEPPSKAKRDFVLLNTRLTAPPLTPEIRLRLADEAVPIWKKTEEELGALGLPPPFWAFAWAGGQALARYVLDNPALVAGKRVLDFGAGSGIVALAAARAGAAEILAADIDKFSIAAINANARANGLTVATTAEDMIGGGE